VLETVNYVRFFPDNPETRIKLPAPIVESITEALQEIGESPEAWGISRSTLAGDTSADLDPLPFAARLIAGTARLVNGVLRRLDPSGNVRSSEGRGGAAPARPQSLEAMFSPENYVLAILSGPLSGLVELRSRDE
jgi:hypothetical protein